LADKDAHMASLPFGLKSRPFVGRLGLVAPFRSPTQEAVRQSLAATLAGEENFTVLTGPQGVGKSLLVHRLVDSLRSEQPCLWVPAAPGTDVAGFLQTLLFELNVDCQASSEAELRLALLNSLLQHAGTGCLLVVDDAHLLSSALFHELRWLAQLICPSGTLVHGVLIGEEELSARLDEPSQHGVRPFLAAQSTLEPLLPEEAIDYVQHHLLQAGARPEQVMPLEACELLVRCAGGAPRLINQLGSRALALACLAEADCIDCEAVLAAAEELGRADESELAAEAPVSLRVMVGAPRRGTVTERRAG
jgi:general secretion pathway protein A